MSRRAAERWERLRRRAARIGALGAACAACAAAALACAPAAEREPPGPEWRERAAAVVAPLRRQLLEELGAALAQGPEHAIEVCRVRAPEIARGLSSESAQVGRTSHRLRNPANAPRAWVEPLLAEYVAGQAQNEPRSVWLASGGVGYVEPIFVAPPCLACHGGELAPSVATRIRELYPQDRATGFAPGEFRGLFWVELAAEGSPPAPAR
jgi:hypothetical protein